MFLIVKAIMFLNSRGDALGSCANATLMPLPRRLASGSQGGLTALHQTCSVSRHFSPRARGDEEEDKQLQVARRFVPTAKLQAAIWASGTLVPQFVLDCRASHTSKLVAPHLQHRHHQPSHDSLPWRGATNPNTCDLGSANPSAPTPYIA